MSESMPHLRKGAMRDFLNIMQEHNYFQESQWEKTNSIYTFPNGSIIEFFGVESWEKVKGARRDILFVNEANHISFETFTQLEIRTKKIIWLDWNPENEFWWYTDVQPNNDVDFLTLTYLDNEGCPPEIVQSIESRRNNINWFKVYGLGQLGEAQGRIFTGWQILDDIPFEAKLVRRGLDFGYSNDPSALVDIYYYNGGYILDEQLYRKGMSNKQIADFITNLNEPTALVKADSAEPKSIDEIKSYGVNILPCEKGKDSVNSGIQRIQDQRISITKRSINGLKEYRNYMWMTDKEGKTLNVPMDSFNHFLDAVRYGMEHIEGPNQKFKMQLRSIQQMALEGEL